MVIPLVVAADFDFKSRHRLVGRMVLSSATEELDDARQRRFRGRSLLHRHIEEEYLGLLLSFNS